MPSKQLDTPPRIVLDTNILVSAAINKLGIPRRIFKMWRSGKLSLVTSQFQKKITKIKPIPRFKNEDEERNFWATHDTTEYFDTTKPVELDLSQLKPSTRPITIRLPETLLWSLKRVANKRDVPYQSLVKILLAEKVEEDSQVRNRRYH